VLGTSADGFVEVEFIGPAEQVTQVDFMLMPTANQTRNKTNIGYMTEVLKLVAPSWSEGRDWLMTNLDQMMRAIEAREPVAERTLTTRNRSLSLRTHTMTGIEMILLSVEAR
jgi:hypothetical protein